MSRSQSGGSRSTDKEKPLVSELTPVLNKERPRRFNQILAAGGSTIALAGTGTLLGFSAVALPALQGPNGEFKATLDEASWIASSVTLGSSIGTTLGGFLSSRLGCRRSILLGSGLLLISWIMVISSQSVPVLCIGRFASGFSSGICATIVQVYVCEIVEPELRGVIGSVPSQMVNIGVFLVYAAGASLPSWRAVGGACMAIPAFMLGFMIFMPESPTWLASRGKYAAAVDSLLWLRDNRDVTEEFHRTREDVRKRDVRGRSVAGLFRRMTHRAVWRPMLVIAVLFWLQQFSGIFAVTFYTVWLCQEAGITLNSYLATVIIGIVRVVITLLTTYLLSRFPRKVLLLVSGIFMAATHMALGIIFAVGPSVTTGWIAFASLILFTVAFSLGFEPIVWLLVPELLPSDVRGIGCGIGFCWAQIAQFTAVKLFPGMMKSAIRPSGTFWVYSTSAVLGTLFVARFVPETRHVTIQQSRDIFGEEESGPEDEIDTRT